MEERASGASLPQSAPVVTPGVLEEVDGTPIGTPTGPSKGGTGLPGFARGIRQAGALAIGRPALWAYALLAFLARGGLLLMLAPIVALPTFVGLANLIGPTSVTASGPTPRLVVIVVAAIALIVGAIVAGTLVAAAAETALYRAAVAADGDDPESALLRAKPASRRAPLHVAIARLALLAPVVAVVAFGVPEYVSVGYQELLLPADLAIPLPIRILVGAPGPSILLVIAWLAGEVLGGLAARRIVLLGADALRGLAGGLGDLALAPVAVLGALVLGLAISLVLVTPGLIAAGFAWEYARIALVDGRDGVAVLAGTLLFAGTWGIALLLAGLAAAFRSALFTVAFADRVRSVPGPG